MSFTYVFPKRIYKELVKLPRKSELKVLQALEEVIKLNHPLFDQRVKKLQGFVTKYRIKISYDLRVVFVIDGDTLVITEIATRQNVDYRSLI